FAGDGARVARAAIGEDGVAHRLAADRPRVLEGAVAEVPRGQDAARLEREHAARGAELMEAVLAAVVVVLEPHELRLRSLLVGRGRRLAAADDDRLEIFAAHDGAEAAAAMKVLQLVHDGREAHAALAGDAALEHANALVAQLVFEAVLDLARELAPVGAGVAKLDLIVLDEDIRRRGRLALDDDAVPARGAQLRPPPAARLRLAVAAGQRRLRRRRVAVAARERQAVDHARHEDEDVVGAERIDAGRELAQQNVRGQRATAQVLAEHGLRNFFDARPAVGEVDVEQLADHRYTAFIMGSG